MASLRCYGCGFRTSEDPGLSGGFKVMDAWQVLLLVCPVCGLARSGDPHPADAVDFPIDPALPDRARGELRGQVIAAGWCPTHWQRLQGGQCGGCEGGVPR